MVSWMRSLRIAVAAVRSWMNWTSTSVATGSAVRNGGSFFKRNRGGEYGAELSRMTGVVRRGRIAPLPSVLSSLRCLQLTIGCAVFPHNAGQRRGRGLGRPPPVRTAAP